MDTENSIYSQEDPGRVDDVLFGVGAIRADEHNRWRVPEGRCYEAMQRLSRHGLSFRTLHHFTDGTRAWDVTAPAYLCMVPESETTRIPQDRAVLLEPSEGVSVLGNGKLVDLISPFAPEVAWSLAREDGLRQVSHAPLLPDPVVITSVLDKDRGETGMWLIEHDGQEFLTPQNVEVIGSVGVAWSDTYQCNEERFPVLPTLVFGGKLVDALLHHGVEFAAPPIYLLKQPLPNAS